MVKNTFRLLLGAGILYTPSGSAADASASAAAAIIEAVSVSSSIASDGEAGFMPNNGLVLSEYLGNVVRVEPGNENEPAIITVFYD